MAEAEPEILITAAEIRRRVETLAAKISHDYSEVDEVFLIGVLRGAFIFLADLARFLRVPRRVDFIALSSYQGGERASGAVRLIMDVRSDLEDKHVLIVEDIVDTGRTLAYLVETFAARRPASLRSCVLVRKPSRVEVPVPIDYLGLEIPDVWVVGYGLDYADRYRTLPYIGVLPPGED